MNATPIYNNLLAQIDKLLKHMNQHSIKTRHRYYEGTLRFCMFAAEEFKLQKFTNMSEKHVYAYVDYMLKRALSPSTIKTDLSGIRAFYDASGGKHSLPDNEEISKYVIGGIGRRKFGEIPRAWTDIEYNVAIDFASQRAEIDICLMIKLARTLGLRVHESTRLTRSDLRNAVHDGFLTIKGKGGRVREVPITSRALIVIKQTLQYAHHERVFVRPGEKTHSAIKRVQNWIYRHRTHFTEGNTTLVYHGLRHAFAQERYEFHLNRLCGDKKAALKAVSLEIGHDRGDVTQIYLAGLEQYHVYNKCITNV